MMQFLYENRLVRSYAVLLIGTLLFFGRRQVFPIPIEQGLPFDIGVASVLNLCYETPSLINCSDPTIIIGTALAVVLAVGWGNLPLLILTAIALPLPLALYFLFGPVWLVFIILLVIPLVMEIGVRFVFGSNNGMQG